MAGQAAVCTHSWVLLQGPPEIELRLHDQPAREINPPWTHRFDFVVALPYTVIKKTNETSLTYSEKESAS